MHAVDCTVRKRLYTFLFFFSFHSLFISLLVCRLFCRSKRYRLGTPLEIEIFCDMPNQYHRTKPNICREYRAVVVYFHAIFAALLPYSCYFFLHRSCRRYCCYCCCCCCCFLYCFLSLFTRSFPTKNYAMHAFA